MCSDNKTYRRAIKLKKDGTVLVMAVFVVLISMVIGTSMLMLGSQSRIEAVKNIDHMMARSAADAGVEFAIQEINNSIADGTWSAAVVPSAVNQQLFHSDSIYNVRTQYDTDKGYSIQSVGTNNSQVSKVTTRLRLKGLFDMALQCRNNIVLKNGTVIQAVDSSVSLNPNDTDQRAMIGTNSVRAGSIVLNNNVKVDGDVVVGVGGDVVEVIKDLGASTLDRYALTAQMEFPVIETPDLVGPDTTISVTKEEKTIGPGGDYPSVGRYSDLKLKNGCVLRVIGECVLYITGDVDMGQSSEIIIDAAAGSASLTIYLDGNWQADNNAGVINTAENTSSFQLYGTGGTGQVIDLKAKGDLFGSVYAPDATVTVFSDGDIYGAIVAESFELKSPACFYYDAALRDVTVYDEGAHYVVNRWNED